MQEKKQVNHIFASRLKTAMKSNGFTQVSLANSMDLSQTAVWRWLKGLLPSSPAFIQLAKNLNVSMAYLIGETDDPAPDENEVGIRITADYENNDKSKAIYNATITYRPDAIPSTTKSISGLPKLPSEPMGDCPNCDRHLAIIETLTRTVESQNRIIENLSKTNKGK